MPFAGLCWSQYNKTIHKCSCLLSINLVVLASGYKKQELAFSYESLGCSSTLEAPGDHLWGVLWLTVLTARRLKTAYFCCQHPVTPPCICFLTTLLWELAQLEKQKGGYFLMARFLGLACCTNASTSAREAVGRRGKGEVTRLSPFSSNLDLYQVEVSRWWKANSQEFANRECSEYQAESGLLSCGWRILGFGEDKVQHSN